MSSGVKGAHRRDPTHPTGRVARRRLRRSWVRRIVFLAVVIGAVLGVVVGLRQPRLDITGGGAVAGGPGVRSRIRLGGDLIAAVSGEGRLWVMNRAPKSLIHVDPLTGATAATILLPATAMTSLAPPSLVVGSGGVWLPDAGESILRRVDASRDRVVDQIPLPGVPVSVALSPDSVWLGLESGDVVRVALSTDHLVGRIQTGGSGAMATTDGALWVVSTSRSSVARVDTKTGQIVATIPVVSRPTGIAAGDGWVWTANQVGTISRIDPRSNTVVETLPISFVPDAITVAGGTVWVANYSSGFLIGITPRPDVRPLGLVLNRKIRWIAGDPDGVVWVCTEKGSILEIR